MKRIWDVLVLTLALNFLIMAGLVGWLYQGGRLDRAHIGQIKQVLFPPAPTAAATTQPSALDPSTRPALVLETLLAQHGNVTAGQQLEYVRKTFDQRQAELERKEQTLTDQQSMIQLAQDKLQIDRKAFEAQRKQFADEQEQARKLASDQGFQDSLNVYLAMPPRQAKTVFVTLGDDVVKQYLEAMPPDTAAKIAAQFKTPDELDRIHRILEKIRQPPATTRPTKE